VFDSGALNMPTRVYLLRHAESADPTVFHGAESDVGLSERGRRQADEAAPLLAARRPEAVVSSAMRRARDTAGPIAAACGLPLRVEPDLHERRVGPFAGTPTRDSDRVYGDTLSRWLAGDTGYAPAGVESFAAVRDRALPVWRRLADELAGRSYVVVAHGFLIRVLLLSVLPGWSVADWHRLGPIRNVAVSELTRGGAGPWGAVSLNGLPAAGPFRLFVYGTLKRGGVRHVALAGQLLLGAARTTPRYELLDLGAYPGLVRAAAGRPVEGELYEVGLETLPGLDAAEGAPALFRLDLVELLDDGGPAFAYFYQPEPGGARPCAAPRWDNAASP
jgi:broad specificity phosphatase PhoE/gamma-glutamylcyclotransferase (GGCT)/AIG2-like uncharacterized protein YtfP